MSPAINAAFGTIKYVRNFELQAIKNLGRSKVIAAYQATKAGLKNGFSAPALLEKSKVLKSLGFGGTPQNERVHFSVGKAEFNIPILDSELKSSAAVPKVTVSFPVSKGLSAGTSTTSTNSPMTLTRADFEKLTPTNKSLHFQKGGKLVDNPKPLPATGTITAAQFETKPQLMTRTEFDKLSAADKSRFFQVGGKLTS